MKIFNIKTSIRKVWQFFVYLLFLISGSNSDDNVPGNNEPKIDKLPFCGGSDTIRDSSRRLLFVSTLDGRLSALDIANGTVQWSVPTNPGPMLSSSIHNYEMAHNFKSVRLIPSLNGNLYKFDGNDIEQIAVTAEDLLSSSFKFSDELVTSLVISGGKETRSYGVSTRNGRVMYECSIHGCKDTTDFNNDIDQYGGPYEIEEEPEHDPLLDDVIIIRRETQTVRAVEALNGGERWNFSVGTHELELIKSGDCHKRPLSDYDEAVLDLELKVIVPEGIVCAVNKHTPHVILWQHKFSHPIVNAWKNSNDVLVKLDLFSYTHLPFGRNDAPNLDGSPTVYVAMYEKQLYIQESDKLKRDVILKNLKYVESLKIPWKPHAVTTPQFAMIEGDLRNIEPDDESSVTALSVLHASEYVNGNGFYLFANIKPTESKICEDNKTRRIEGIDDIDIESYEFPTKILIASLWFWWKEIMVISLTTALLLNVMLSQSQRLTIQIPIAIPEVRQEVVVVERHIEVPMQMSEENLEVYFPRLSICQSSGSDNFVSRFQADFDMQQCLGKGGFGVVFEVKNKLDDCKYAIKRIVLPNRQESRDRVMREVKTLAHCEHQNIVRYFQAWVETPPPGWQENEDKIWMDREALSHSIDIDSPTEITQSMVGTYNVFNEVINQKDKALDNWISTMNTNECINFDDIKRKTSFKKHSIPSFKRSREHTNRHLSDSILYSKDAGTIDVNDDSFDLPATIDCSNDSFEIEFREQTMSGDGCHYTSSDNSLQIESKSPPNGLQKQRTYSVDDDFSKGFIKGTARSSKPKIDVVVVEHFIPEKQIVPFRKTHRRPMSLDLSSRRSVQSLHSNRIFLYIQMQLCKKQSLKDWLRQNCLESRQEEIVPIFKQIVDGVEYCHLKGLIHRDLKPSNIFFSLDGQIKIGDFGLVTDMADRPNSPCGEIDGGYPIRFNHTGQVGTHLYMSPEQLQGLEYNYKVDIYSLGLIFFELLVVFGTEMERIETLKSLRMSNFPSDFHLSFPNEYKLLKLMLSTAPQCRPTTIGVRAHAPLSEETSIQWHFDLPPRRRDSQASSGLSSNSSADTLPSKSN